MNFSWSNIKDGYRGFEALAVEFVNSVDKGAGNCWKKSKRVISGYGSKFISRPYC